MKKVLYLTNVPAPYTVEFFNGLGEKLDLTVIYERKTAQNRDKRWFSNNVKNYQEVFLNGINFGPELAFCPGVIKYIKKEKWDLIIVGDYSSPTGIYAIEYMRRKKTSFYIHVDGGIVGSKSGLRYKIKTHLMSSAKGFFSPGEKTDEYLKIYGGTNPLIYHYPFSSVSKNEILEKTLSKKQKNVLRQNLGLEDLVGSGILAISVGSVIPRKGYDILIKAASKIEENIVFIIVGGKPTEELKKLILDAKLDNIYFIDFVKPEEVKLYLKASDLFVMSTRYDIWGLVVNEAMAMGLPVISTNMCVSACELVKNNCNGYIVDSESSDELAKAIKKFLSLSGKTQEEFSEKSLEIVRDYSIEEMIEKYYNNIIHIIEEQK